MTNKQGQATRRYGTFSLFTLFSVYLLILIGGIVRATGSGMGCPDWPKCFDQWIPPTSESELPENYREIYSEYRYEKNVRFASYLNLFGMEKTAEQLLTDKSILEERPFNAAKTWIEYINRLVGALIGVFILMTVLFAIPYIKSDPGIFWTALGTLILVIFQGWIGSIVVSTNLVPWMVTFHMLIAIVIVAMLVNLVYRSRKGWSEPYHVKEAMKGPLSFYTIVAIILTLIQIILGTQVRESVDEIAVTFGNVSRDAWISELGMVFIVHRSFSWLIFFLNGYLFYLLVRQNLPLKLMSWIGIGILGSALTGLIMNYFGIPAVIQPIHLLLGTAIIGLQFFLFLHLKNSEPVPENVASA